MSTPKPPPGGQPASAGRARTLPLQRLVNRVIRGLLRTPVLCRLTGKRLITVYLATPAPATFTWRGPPAPGSPS
jgi:hypothetical protein